jgi:hypothetical protein
VKSKKSKTGPKPENGVLRVRLQTCGPLVRAETAAVLDAWRDSYGVPIGRSIDALIDFAKAHPEKFIIKKPKLKNECKIDVENLG